MAGGSIGPYGTRLENFTSSPPRCRSRIELLPGPSVSSHWWTDCNSSNIHVGAQRLKEQFSAVLEVGGI